MSHFDSFARVAAATVGAIVLATTFVGSAVGPAVAHSTAPAQMAYASVEPGLQARG
ncbi:hypothetical protein GCM10023232_06540 [Sphingosinicella ginsenosidimutans]|uniref:hypothetical protein n=1 Tax=Allosphingosinicella ginsenosidimutans TaxID=1176539 RepID=UPI00131556A0|nr:hypothetical protein [Sphingosinicella ginsenosidimutans]